MVKKEKEVEAKIRKKEEATNG
jgi:hypothetical protein